MSQQPDKVSTKVKWGKESIELDWILCNGVMGFKKALSDATGVPNDRMKLMCKSKGLWKGVLKDNTDLTTITGFKDFTTKPIQILLMGSATTLPTAPKTKTIFIEDLPPEEAAKVAAEPAGLVNLGNTCYLNSVLQCLRPIEPLRESLKLFKQNSISNSSPSAAVLSSMNDTFNNLDRTTNALSPSNLVMSIRMRFPQFAQRSPAGPGGMGGGGWMQQDAEELYSSLLSLGAEEMSGANQIQRLLKLNEKDTMGATNVMDTLFGIEMQESQTCDENPDDVTTNIDNCLKLVCNIQGGGDVQSDVNINHIQEGVLLSLQGKIEKHSETLGRDALYTRQQRISRLPPYLVVQFGRFYWKATPDSQDHAGVKCKIMKPVAFDSTLDVMDFCVDAVKNSLKSCRDHAIQQEEEAIQKKLKGEDNNEDKMDVDNTTQQELENVDDDEASALKAALQMSMDTSSELITTPVGPSLLPNDFQGYYELFGVVTHKGRDADGGHYMGWVCDEGDNWFVFDDDEVSPCTVEDVLKLKGGGDWHMSYLNFYRAKK